MGKLIDEVRMSIINPKMETPILDSIKESSENVKLTQDGYLVALNSEGFAEAIEHNTKLDLEKDKNKSQFEKHEELKKQQEINKPGEVDLFIWKQNKETGQLFKVGLDVIKCKNWLLKNNQFITIGDKIYSILVYTQGYYKIGGEKTIQELMQKATNGKYLTINSLREILAHIQRETFTTQEKLLETPKRLICLKNGVLDTKTKQLQKHNPNLIFTQQIPVNYIPDVDCPNFKKFLSEVANPDDIPAIQEMIGHLLIRNYSYKKAFIICGIQNSGKTTFLKIIVSFIGKENTSSLSLHSIVKDKFAAIHLNHKLLNFYDDLSSEDINDAGALKIVTGNGYVSGEHKFGERVHFENYAKLVFACNEIFGLKNKNLDDDAYYGRWILFFFNNTFDGNKQNKQLFENLTNNQELSGILNWALQGLQRLEKQGTFSYNKTPDEVKALMQRGSNSIAAFAQDCLEEISGSWISKEEMYMAYSSFIKKQGGGLQTKEKLGRDLSKFANYCLDSKKDKITGWLNVSLNQAFHTNFKLTYNKEISIFSHARNDKNSMNSMIPQEIKHIDIISFEDLQGILLDKPNQEALTADLVGLGFLESQLDDWKGEGLIFEPKSGWVRLL